MIFEVDPVGRDGSGLEDATQLGQQRVHVADAYMLEHCLRPCEVDARRRHLTERGDAVGQVARLAADEQLVD